MSLPGMSRGGGIGRQSAEDDDLDVNSSIIDPFGEQGMGMSALIAFSLGVIFCFGLALGATSPTRD